MDDRPVVLIPDVPLEGSIPRYLAELLRRTEVRSPERLSRAELQSDRESVVACISRSQPVGRADIAAMPDLRLLSAWGVGYNHIDVEAATERRIPVCINPVFTQSMAEAALTFIFALSKRLPALVSDARSGRRTLQSERGQEIRGKRLGIVGYGRIGKRVAELCERLGMVVQATDPIVPPGSFPDWCRSTSLDQLLQSSDFIVITAPLTPQTFHMIGAAQLAQLKNSAFLINIARGPLVDEKALFDVLKAGRIAGAALDVWEQEPVTPDNPLLSLDNVLATPHKIGATWDGLQRLCESIQSNVFAVLSGQRPQHVINPEVFEED